MPNRISRRTSYGVHDKPGLSALFRRVIDEQYDGVQFRAAYAIASRRLGRVVQGSSRDLPEEERTQVRKAQSLLSRVLNGKVKGIGEANYAALRQLIPPPLLMDFEDAILSPGVGHLLMKYETWLVKDRIRADRLSKFRQRVLEDLRQRFPDEFKRIDDVVEKWGHSATRAQIAVDRVVEPILDYGPSYGIERVLVDLTEKELRGFVKAGVQRQVILLQRKPDRQRAQEIVKRKSEGKLDPEVQRPIPEIIGKGRASYETHSGDLEIIDEWRAFYEANSGPASHHDALENYLVELEYRLEGGSIEDFRGLREFRSKRAKTRI